MSFAKQTSGSGSSSSSAFVPAADAVMAQISGASAAPDLAPSANANASANGTLAAAAAPFAGMY